MFMSFILEFCQKQSYGSKGIKTLMPMWFLNNFTVYGITSAPRDNGGYTIQDCHDLSAHKTQTKTSTTKCLFRQHLCMEGPSSNLSPLMTEILDEPDSWRAFNSTRCPVRFTLIISFGLQ